jgi:hypothetical protein
LPFVKTIDEIVREKGEVVEEGLIFGNADVTHGSRANF